MTETILDNRYRLLHKLGDGGMAEVYKALDTLLDREVTIKILRAQFAGDQEFIRRFRREAQAVAKLSHPNIVSLFDVAIDEKAQYIVMEYVEGVNLKEYLKEKAPLGRKEILSITGQICDALEHAHTHKIVHRDIKPHNILITPKGRVKVADFGIARAVSEATVTYSGEFVGSVHYLSPEQAKGELTDYKSDIYSLGVVLYEMATGRVPYEGESPITIALKHIQDTPLLPTEIDSTISKDIEYIILKAMSKDKEERFASARDMKRAIDRSKNNNLSSANGREYKLSKGSKNGKKQLKPMGWVLIAAAVLVVLISGFSLASRWIAVSEVSVPDVVGLPLEEAALILENEGLIVEIEREQHHLTIPKNHIIGQTPKSLSTVRKGRSVELEVSLGPQLQEVPNVVGENIRNARIRIENSNFSVAPQVEEVFSAEYAQGMVIGQNPAGATMHEIGADISLVVSKGPKPEEIQMPNLVSMTLAEAEELLRQRRLNIGIISYQESNTYFTGQVAGQDVASGAKITQGSTINLVVSRGPGPKEEMVTVTVQVADDGVDHVIKIVVEDLKGQREEYLSRHQSGEYVEASVPFFGKGIIRVYQDDELVHEKEVTS